MLDRRAQPRCRCRCGRGQPVARAASRPLAALRAHASAQYAPIGQRSHVRTWIGLAPPTHLGVTDVSAGESSPSSWTELSLRLSAPGRAAERAAASVGDGGREGALSSSDVRLSLRRVRHCIWFGQGGATPVTRHPNGQPWGQDIIGKPPQSIEHTHPRAHVRAWTRVSQPAPAHTRPACTHPAYCPSAG